jgi:drug/metabolite transporter (DMT)-like permease
MAARRLRRGQLIWGAIGGIAFAAIWSGSFVATKVALSDASPLFLAGIRLSLAGIALLILTFPSARALWQGSPGRMRGAIVVSGLLYQAFYLGATYCALVNLPTGLVTIIVATLPLVSVPIAFAVLRERPGAIDILAAGFGLIGVVIVTLGRNPHALAAQSFLLVPVLLTAASVVALAAGNALVKSYISPKTVMPVCAIQMALSGPALMILAAAFEPDRHFILAGSSLAALAYLVLIGSILGTYIWYRVLSIYAAKSASLFFLFTPIFGLAIGWTVLGETMTPAQLFGAAVVCVSILLRSGVRPRPRRLPWPARRPAGGLAHPGGNASEFYPSKMKSIPIGSHR